MKHSVDSIIRSFDPGRIRPLPDQPRKRFAGIKELADSIAEVGQTCPGIVTLIDGSADFDAQLVDGERRLRACQLAGMKFRAEVRADGPRDEIFAMSFAANFGKQNHDPIEIAHGLRRLRAAGKTQTQMAAISGRSQMWVSDYLSLMKLHPSVHDLMTSKGDEEPKLVFSQARELVHLPESLQIKLARKITEGSGISLKKARWLIEREKQRAGLPIPAKVRSMPKLKELLDDFSRKLSRYVNLNGAEMNALIDQAAKSMRVLIIEKAEDVSEGLVGIKEAIEDRGRKINLR